MFVSFFWHFHQPLYRDPENNEYILPWVNYHTTRNYHQMARLVEEAEFPCAFNFTPCLLEQIHDYATGKAMDQLQKALEVSPESLTSRLKEILRKIVPKEKDDSKLQLAALESLFSPVVETQKDKDILLGLQKKILAGLIPSFQRLRNVGLVEVTTSPYYHPLLPLLIDIRSAKGERLPSRPFQYPEDAELQLQKGRDFFKKMFGVYPRGLWPSEGGISREAAEAAASCGFEFAVTDENILWKSLDQAPAPKALYMPYTSGGLTVFFRDRELSDLISFEYQKWNEKEAVSHFLAKLDDRRKNSAEDALCVVALDGENPWPYYRENAVPFLRELFERIKMHGGISPVLLENYLSRHKPTKEITLVAGTWLGNFSKWVGHPAKNAAWERLSRARGLCGPREEILISEGSDWFWWYGEENTQEFDLLFQKYIQKAYASAGLKEKDA